MASIETLIAQIDDIALRDKVGREVAEMKKRLDWGLVFERHLPENVRAISAPIRPGSVVWERRTTTPRRLRVRSIEGADVVVAAEPERTTAPADAPTERIARTEVLVEQDFAEPVFPVVTPIGAIRNGSTDAPYHAVIQGENYHAIQALLAAYERSFDLIYLDPPYNTGNREWSYNNDYVDPSDTYRPSKWLAFMERRLKIARKLLAPDGIVVVAIDKNEHAHLVMLLEQLFAGWDITSVAIQHNPRGVQGDNFSTNEFAAAAGAKRDVSILDFFGGSGTTLHATMLLNAEDGQHRTCVLVTNNELKAETAERLNQAGHFRGDETFEAAGVYRAAAYPRVTAAVRGTKPDGAPIPGEYLDTNRAHAAGFTENVEFFRLDYLDPAEVEFGLGYGAIEPLLWLRAGGIGEREALDSTAPLGLPAHSPYAVLFDPAGLPDLLAALPARTDITHVFIVADSPESFAQVVADLPREGIEVRLYRDYLETMRGATR